NVSSWFTNDGALQARAYADFPANEGGYAPVNQPMATGLPGVGPGLVDPNRWQPLAITNAVDQNGFPQGPIQKFLGSQWLGVRPFALGRTNSALPWINLGPPPCLNGVGDAEFRSNVVD